MDKKYPREAWQRLGKKLEARRGQLGYGYRQREQFLTDRGGPPPALKTIARLERGERTSYPPDSVTRLEALYGWAPGSFEAVLEGGDPVPLPDLPAFGRLHPVPSPAGLPLTEPGQPAEEVIALILSRYPDDDIVRLIAQQAGKPAKTRLEELAEWVAVKYPASGRNRAAG